MNMKAINPNAPQKSVEERYRQSRTLWIYRLVGLLSLYITPQLIGRPEGVEPNDKLFLVFVIISVGGLLSSFPIKSWFLRRAVDAQAPERVGVAYSAAFMLSDLGSLLGVIDFFITGDRYFHVLFIIAAVGLLFHFPRRQHFLNAAFKSSTF